MVNAQHRSVSDLRFPSMLMAILGLVIAATPLALIGLIMGAVALTFGIICQRREPSRLTVASTIIGAAAVLVGIVMAGVYMWLLMAPLGGGGSFLYSG